MYQQLFKNCLTIFLVFACLKTAAQPISIAEGGISRNICESLYFVEDVDRKLSAENLLELEPGLPFKKNTWGAVNFGYVKNPYWFRFELKNETDSWQNLILEVQNPYINRTQLLEKKADTLIASKMTGDHFPALERPWHNRHFCFPIELAPNEFNTYYLLIDQSNEGLRTFINLCDQQKFLAETTIDTMLYAGAMGISVIIILIAFNFALAFRQRIFYLYLLYFIFLLLTLITTTGFGFLYLYPTKIGLQQVAHFQAIGAAGMVATLFSLASIKDIIKIGRWKWIPYTYLLMAAYLIIMGILFDAKKENNTSPVFINTSYIISIANYLLLSIFIFKAWVKTWQSEMFLLLVLILFGATSWTILFLTELGLMSFSSFASDFGLYWVVYETLLASVAMFFRVKMLYDNMNNLEESLYIEKQKAVKEFVKGQHIERQRLSQDLHDGISLKLANVKAQLSNLQLKLKDQPLKEYIAPILGLVSTTAEDVRNFSHSLGSVTLLHFGIAPAIEDLIAMLQTSYPNVKLAYDDHGFVPESLDEEASLYLLQILQELLNNVYKHAQATKVMVQVTTKGDTLVATVLDNGVGYDPAILSIMGLGLKSIRSRVLLLEGEFEVAKKVGGGMRHTIYFPLDHQNGRKAGRH